MNRILMAGTLALAAAAQQAATAQNPLPTAPTPATQQQQAIPDAPKPQPALGPVTPGIGTTSSSSTTAAPEPDQPAVPTALPATAAQQPADADPAPDLPAAGQGPQEIYRLGPLVANFVDVPFTVKDSKGNLVPGITWRDVRVYENGVRQSPKVFTADPFPLSVALVIDQSLPHDTMAAVNQAIGAIPTAFSSYDEVAVFTYNNGPRLETPFTAGQSARLASILERTKNPGRDTIYYNAGEALSQGININGGAEKNLTPLTGGGPGSPQGLSQQQVPREVHTLNDAILMAAESLAKVAPDRRRVVYVISDGKEYGSKAKPKQVIEYLQTNRVAVYATIVGDSSLKGMGFLDRVHIPLMMRDNILPVYVNATGGQSYAEYRYRGIETSFSKITEQVRTQYTIGYYSREPFIDGKYRKLEVRVLKPNLQVIAKDGYYPSAQAVRPATVTPVSTTQR